MGPACCSTLRLPPLSLRYVSHLHFGFSRDAEQGFASSGAEDELDARPVVKPLRTYPPTCRTTFQGM